MKQKLKKLYLFPLLISLCIFGCMALFLQRDTRGFSLKKIKSPLEFSTKWMVDTPSRSELNRIKVILRQDFNYLGSGAQSYAFLSSDGKYVLKFFKMNHLLPKTYLKYLPIPGLDKYRFNKLDKRILRQQALFASYKMAYVHLKNETGLVYIHLNKTKDLNQTVHLFDRMHNSYQLQLDDYEFILQKKVHLLRDRISVLMQNGDKTAAVDSLRKLLNHVVVQCQKGFIDRDSGISNNYGFVGDQVVHFDVGRIMQDETAKDPAHYQREVLRISKKLEQWLQDVYPELLPDFEEVVDQIIEKTSL